MCDGEYRPEGFFPAAELDMLRHDTARTRRWAELHGRMVRGGMLFGAEVDEFADAREGVAAMRAYPITDWWNDPAGQALWNHPVTEP
ncbi:hypothetical protein [Saccharomonospora iraqiensis]|uniref:hypothetical protein n=1 Tax=Saccharomonospora iraqiensis TaxID=52698 RepID=UPI00042642A5|nr:hypothetical protein [Saccharomonospora iraqiensis]